MVLLKENVFFSNLAVFQVIELQALTDALRLSFLNPVL